MAGRKLRSHSGEKIHIPKGVDHLRFLYQCIAVTEHDASPAMAEHLAHLRIIGTSLAALYEVGTCNRRCFGNAHILESLCGRAYNLGCSAFLLMERGFYDEALNLVRSLGEIANLVDMSTLGDNSIQEWIRADRRTRLRNFSPAKIRQRLKDAGRANAMIATDDWYQEFCEQFTHPTPNLGPNKHNDKHAGVVGGAFQRAGLTRCMAEMSTTLSWIAVIACLFAELKDLASEITALLRKLSDGAHAPLA